MQHRALRRNERSSEAPGAGNPHSGICKGLLGNRQFYLNGHCPFTHL